jgi:glycerol uptake facilitator-like aquaporin
LFSVDASKYIIFNMRNHPKTIFFLAEGMVTFMLFFIVSSQRRPTVKSATALTIGVFIGWAAYCDGPLTGASLNPARSLGPALLSGCTEDLAIYIMAPPVRGGSDRRARRFSVDSGV